jgi:hypothetical protein
MLANDGHDQCDPTRKLTATGKPWATTHSGGISSSSMARAWLPVARMPIAFQSPSTRTPRSGRGTRNPIGSRPVSVSTAADRNRWVARGQPVKNVLVPDSR